MNMDALRGILKDELLQILVTGVVALCLLGIQQGLDTIYLPALLSSASASAPGGTMMEAAGSRISYLAETTNGVLSDMSGASIELGREASKGVFCNFLGAGFTLVNCSPLNAFRGSLTTGAFAASVALADAYAQRFLLSLACSFAFSVIVPLGLFLRCFKLSRGAGGALIAIGFGFYTVYPFVIVSTENLLHGPTPPLPPYVPHLQAACDPMETSVSSSLGAFKEYSASLTDFGVAEGITHFVMVRVLFLSILNLIITLGFIRAFAHIIGSEIDVSALARIA